MFVPFGDDEEVARTICVVLVALVPLFAGAVVATMRNNRGAGVRRVLGFVASGYVYAAVIGLTMALLVVLVPLRKVSHLVTGFAVLRVMIMIPDGSYDDALEELRTVLEDAGIDAEVEDPHVVLLSLFRWLGWILGRIFDRDVADRMQVLRGYVDGDWFENILHAADLSIIGSDQVTHQILAVLIDGVDERAMYLTWDMPSQALEDRIRAARDRLEQDDRPTRQEFEVLVSDLVDLQLERETWDAVRRLIYRLERDTALAATEADDHPAPAQTAASGVG